MNEPRGEIAIPEQVLAATKMKVQNEIKAHNKEYPRRGLVGFLNNFQAFFIPNSPGLANYQRNFLNEGELTPKQWLAKYYPGINPSVSFSPKRSETTGIDFVADIRRAIQEEGLIGEKADGLEQRIEGRVNLREVNQEILPVYIRLRAMGYEHQDLTT